MGDHIFHSQGKHLSKKKKKKRERGKWKNLYLLHHGAQIGSTKTILKECFHLVLSAIELHVGAIWTMIYFFSF